MFQVVDAGCRYLCKHLLCHNSVPVAHVALADGGRLLLTEGHHASTIVATIVGLCCLYGIALPYSVDKLSAGWQCKLTVLHDVSRWAMLLLPTCKWCTHPGHIRGTGQGAWANSTKGQHCRVGDKIPPVQCLIRPL